jgi:hypothetical protein
MNNWRCDDTSRIGTADYNCTCNNAAGTYAVSYENSCAQTPCIYADRCLANGFGCIPGAGGTACDRCFTAADIALLGPGTTLNAAGYYKVGQICEVCPATSAAQIIGAAGAVLVLAFFGFKASQVMGAQATNNMKKIVESLQFFSLSLGINVKYPGPVLNLGRYLEAFTFSIEFLRPECVATGLNWLNIFIASVFVVPLGISLIIFINNWRANRKYDRTVRAIHSERLDDGATTMYWIERPGFLWGTRRTFQSKSGDKVVKELQRQYHHRASLRSFGVLSMTVLYLPIIRMCLQSYDCISMDGVDGLRLEHDIDIDCESPGHQAIQATASIMLVVVGFGMPLYAIYQVRKIRLAGKLDDPRTLDAYGAFYDIYRRQELTHAEKLEIVRVSTAVAAKKKKTRASNDDTATLFDAETERIVEEIQEQERVDEMSSSSDDEVEHRASEKVDVERGDDATTAEQDFTTTLATRAAALQTTTTTTEDEENSSFAAVSSSFKRMLSIGRTSNSRTMTRTPSARARERAAKMHWKDQFALYYLAMELAQKSGVILATSQFVANTALSGWVLVVVHWSIGAFVYVCQPWRIITIGFGKVHISNCLNKVEAAAGFLQGAAPCLAMIFPVQRDEETGVVVENTLYDVMTMVLTVIITGLLSIRVVVFVGERLATKRKKMNIIADPEKSVQNMHKKLIDLAKSRALVSLFAFKADFDIKRRKARARLEDTRHAMLLRVDHLKDELACEEEKIHGTASEYERRRAKEEQIVALYEIANEMAHVVNVIVPTEGVSINDGATVAEQEATIDAYLEELLAQENARHEALIKASGVSMEHGEHAAAMHVVVCTHVYDRVIERLEGYMQEYAGAEQLSELVTIAQRYVTLRSEQLSVFRAFGESETREALDGARKALDALRPASREDDFDALVSSLGVANDIVDAHEQWCANQNALFSDVYTLEERNPDFLPDAPALTKCGFKGAMKNLKTHSGALSDVLKQSNAECAPLFVHFGRVKYMKGFAEQVRHQLELNALGPSMPAEAKRVYDKVVQFTDNSIKWCTECIYRIEHDASRVFDRFKPIAHAVTRSLEKIRVDAQSQAALAQSMLDAINALIANQHAAESARRARDTELSNSKRSLQTELDAQKLKAETDKSRRDHALAEDEARARREVDALERTFDSVKTDIEKEIATRDRDIERLRTLVTNSNTTFKMKLMTKEKKAVVDAAAAASLRAEYKAAKAHRAELERTLKAETRAIKTQKSEILAALDARRRDVKRETMAEESHIKKAELAMHKTIGKETAVAIRTSEEDIIARNSEVEASKKLNKHKLVAVAMERNATMLSSKIERKLSTVKKSKQTR